jgi:amino acid transporter/nucleotide-binding universal stress UspA family protein
MSIDTQDAPASRSVGRAAQVVVVSSVMFTFISFWRTAAVVLCDMSSTVYYVGAIVENEIGKAAPWFILAVLLFSYGMRAVYIESCALFVRGGVYRIVKEALGGFWAKAAVSALLFDYVLTGPISGVSAGQYIVGLVLETLTRLFGLELGDSTRDVIKAIGSIAIACTVTFYFLHQNLLGIHESSGKALRIMVATTVMAIVMLVWSGVTLVERSVHPDPQHPVNPVPSWQPDLSEKWDVDEKGKPIPKRDKITGEQQDPLGAIGRLPKIAEPIRNPPSWLSLFGIAGIIIAFGHSILAMSGEETLAQVYREVESPKLKNFKRVGFIVFAYSLLLTGSMNFLAVMLIPDRERMSTYYDNWMGGLAMHMVGPVWLLLLLNAFVVFVGFLILSGAVNTSIVGSNGVLSRVAEDGVLPDWFLKPHPRYGTNYRLLYMIAILQLVTILASRGDVILLGEAYAFGVVWSFVFNTLSMVVLRFKKRGDREFVVPLNIRIGDVYFPIGLGLVFLTVFVAAIANLFTKTVATTSGICFAGAFLSIFTITEAIHRRRRGTEHHEHIEQFNRETVHHVTKAELGLARPYCKLVAIRSPHNLFMLDKALADTDPTTTDVVVMTAKVEPLGAGVPMDTHLDTYDQQLLTAVVNHAERLGKSVTPMLVPTNNALHAVLNTAKDLPAQEVLVGASNKYTAEEQLDQIAFYWINLHGGMPQGLTVHVVSQDRDVTFDLDGGNRIPKAAERQARSIADLRAAGIGVRRVLFVHDGTRTSSDVFEWMLTMMSSSTSLDVVRAQRLELGGSNGQDAFEKDRQWAEQLGREINVLAGEPQPGPEIISMSRDGNYDAIILPAPSTAWPAASDGDEGWMSYVVQHAPCPVFIAVHPNIPREVVG